MIKNILANWSNVIISILAVFVLYPFFVKTLGEEQYGVWLLISSATGYFSLLQMGVPRANVRFISKYYARQEYEQLSEVVCTNLFFFTVGAFFIFLFGFGLSSFLDVIFEIPPEFILLAKSATLLVCLEISIRFVFEVFEGFFHAKQQFVAFNVIKNVMIVVRIIAVFYFVQYENGLLKIALVLLLVTFIQSIVFYVYVRIKNPFLKLHYKYVKLKVLKKVFSYSVFVLLLELATRLSFHTDTLVIGRMISVSTIVWFTIGNNLILYSMKFMSGISNALMPKISSMEANGNLDTIGNIYFQYSRVVMFLVLPVCLSFWCFGGDFIELWMGEQYRIVSGRVLSILTTGYIFYFVQSGVAMPILMGTSRVKYPTLLMFFSALLNLCLSILFAKVYGIYGVAWGTTLPLLAVVVAICLYMCKTFNVHVGHYVSGTILSPFFSTLPFFLTYFFWLRNVKIDSYMLLFFSITVCVILYLFTVFFFCLSQKEKAWVLEKINQLLISKA